MVCTVRRLVGWIGAFVELNPPHLLFLQLFCGFISQAGGSPASLARLIFIKKKTQKFHLYFSVAHIWAFSFLINYIRQATHSVINRAYRSLCCLGFSWISPHTSVTKKPGGSSFDQSLILLFVHFFIHSMHIKHPLWVYSSWGTVLGKTMENETWLSSGRTDSKTRIDEALMEGSHPTRICGTMAGTPTAPWQITDTRASRSLPADWELISSGLQGWVVIVLSVYSPSWSDKVYILYRCHL